MPTTPKQSQSLKDHDTETEPTTAADKRFSAARTSAAAFRRLRILWVLSDEAVLPTAGPRRRKKVAIIAACDSKHEAPWEDSSFEFWGNNNLHNYMEQYPWSRWFQLHNRPYLEKHWAYGMPNHLGWARQQRQLPFYVFEPRDWPDVRTARRFPVEAIWQLTSRGRYHAGSADWQVAYAILEGFQEIHLYGWNLGPMDNGEPLSARACLEYWLGVAEGRGIKIHVAGDNLFRTYYYVRSKRQYGYHDLRNEITDHDTIDGLPAPASPFAMYPVHVDDPGRVD